MLVDANLLLYAIDETSPSHLASAEWLEEVLNGDRRVGLPWMTIGAFVRISTHPRVMENPLTPTEAWGYVDAWLNAWPTWIPPATERTATVLGRLITDTPASGNLVTDALLAALAIEHGLIVQTADTDFGRFDGVRWNNPLVAT